MNKQLIAILAIIGLSLVFSAKKEDCTIVTCNSNDIATDTGVCGTATKNSNGVGYNVSIQSCRDGYYCPDAQALYGGVYTQTSVSCKKDELAGLWNALTDALGDLVSSDHCISQHPGEACSQNAHCFSGKCTSGKCEGAASGASCTIDKNCNAGLYCEASKCTAQKAAGESCNDENECQNTLTCSNNKCVAYYSLANGTETMTPNACNSGLIRVSGTKVICDSRTLTTNSCTDTTDSCVYTWASDSKTDDTVGCQCDSTRKTNSRSCAAAAPAKPTTYTNIHTELRWTGSCKSDYATYDECLGEAIFGAAYTNNSSILKVGFALFAAMMIFF